MLSRKVDPSFPFALQGQQVVRGLASPMSVGFTVPGARSGQIPPPGSVPVAGVCLLVCGSRAGVGGGQWPGPWDTHVWLWPPLTGGLPTPQASFALSGTPWTGGTVKASVPGPRALWAGGRCQQLGRVGGAPERMHPPAPCSVPGWPWEPCLLLLEKLRLWKVGASAQGRDRSFCPRTGQPGAQKSWGGGTGQEGGSWLSPPMVCAGSTSLCGQVRPSLT